MRQNVSPPLESTLTVWSTHLSLDLLRTRLATTEVVAATTLPPPLLGVYEGGALVPSTAWRRLSDNEFAILTAKEPQEAPAYASVVLLAPTPLFTAELAAIARDQAAVSGMDSLHPAPADLQALLHALLVRDGALTLLGPPLSTCVSMSPGGLNTITPNRDRSLTGLHVDSWDGLVLGERRRGSNRLVINIGTSPRYLIFSPYEVAVIAEAMGWSDETGLDVARAFLQGDRRVYRLEVRPGEAYLAPTENFIHDVSSIGSDGPDRALMLRGFLEPASKRATQVPAIGHGPADLYLTNVMRQDAFKDALTMLGGPSVTCVVEHRRSAVNDIYRLKTNAEGFLALRIRRRLFVQDADAWQVKSVLCARLVQGDHSRLNLPLSPYTSSAAEQRPILLRDAPPIYAYRHGCAASNRPPWEICEWIFGPQAGECPDPRHFAEIGSRLAALHTTRFAEFRTGIGPSGHETDGVAWLRKYLCGLATPTLERRIGRQSAIALRRGCFDTKVLRWSLLHGDLHAGNVIVTSDGIRFIDWDEATVGPPEFDFAPLKHVTRLQADREWVPDAALYSSALEGYRNAGGAADEMLLAFGELLYLLKRFHSSLVERQHAAHDYTVDAIVDLIADVLK